MVIARSKANRTLVVTLIMIAVNACEWGNSHSTPLPNMPHYPDQGIYLQAPAPLNPIRQPLLP